jgi:hypothetical protein
MLNPNIPVKKWFKTQIETLTGLTVYDGEANDQAGEEYIVLEGRTSSQEQGKSGFISSVVIVVDIITKSANFGFKRAETISDLITVGIDSDTDISLSSGFSASALSIDGIRTLEGLNPADNVFRVLITYNLTVTQN